MFPRFHLTVFAFLLFAGLLFSQVTTTGDIRGSVLDPSGATVPGVELKLVDEATGAERTAVSSQDGGFVFVRVQAGTYKITATAKGFQTTVSSGITVETARTTDVVMRLALGAVTQAVEVKDAATALETSSNTVSSTVRNQSIQELPVSGRNLLGFSLLTAGAQRGSTDRDSDFNGLPNASLNISLDGIANNDWRFKSGGTSMFVFAPLRLGAMEEVNVSTTGMGADASGSGAMQIRWVTKRGSNTFHGSGFWEVLNDAFNANSWFNNANGLIRPRLHHNEFGGNIGGPIWKNKVFFFINYEHLLQPAQTSVVDTVLSPSAQQGIFTYTGTDGSTHSANVLQIANAAGFPSQVDATIASQLARVNTSTALGVITTQNLFLNNLTFNRRGGTNDIREKYPTARLDYQISPSLAFSTAWNLRWRDINGSPTYPGFHPQSEFISTYFIVSAGLTWTIKPTMFNEFRYGVQGGPEMYNANESLDQFNVNGRLQQINYPFSIPLLTRNTLPSPDNNPVFNFNDNLNWVKGTHTLTFGGSWLHAVVWDADMAGGNEGGNAPGVPQLYVNNVSSNDPIASVLTSATLPAIRSTDLPNALNLYAMLTGRLVNIQNTQAVNEHTKQYQPLVPFVRREALTTGGFYVQDSWRVKPTLTVNYGLRFEFTGDNHNTNGIYTSPTQADLLGPSSAPFQPGVLNGVLNPQIYQRSHSYDGRYFNPAPNLGFAWSPQHDTGLLGKILGGGRKTVIRGGIGLTYYQEGTQTFEYYTSFNPGFVQTAFLTPGLPGFSPGALSVSGTLPTLVTVPASFSPPFPQSLFTFSGNTLSTTQQHLHQPYVTNWSFGIQRELYKGSVLEIRYVGNKGTHIWHGHNTNEVNIFENGFLKDFVNAQNNLAINQANGKGATFANTGLPGQVGLPIFEAAFGALGTQPALGASSGFGNGTFITQLQQGQAGALANGLAGTSTYLCRLVGSNLSPCVNSGFTTPGLYPINVFQPNPYFAGSALQLMTDSSNSTYHGLQIEFRRRLGGLTYSANYTFSKSLTDMFAESENGFFNYSTLRNKALNKGPNVFDIRQVFVGYINYSLPFGAGHAISGNSLVNRIIGGWAISSIVRMQSGLPVRLASSRSTVNQNDSGVILNGIDLSQLQSMFTIRPGPNKNISFVNANLIGADGRANPAYIQTPTGPGQFGNNVFVRGPKLMTNDMSIHKTIAIREPVKMELAVDALNAFNHPLFLIGTCTSFVTVCSSAQGVNYNINSTTFAQTTSLAVTPRSLQLRLEVKF